jgi:hypothetical protein
MATLNQCAPWVEQQSSRLKQKTRRGKDSGLRHRWGSRWRCGNVTRNSWGLKIGFSSFCLRRRGLLG